VDQTTPDGIAADTAAAVAHVRSEAGGGADAVFTVGFCFGGRNSFNQSARGHGLAGVIGFYGFPTRRDENDTNAPSDVLDRFEAPVLGLFGGADQAIKVEFVEQFREALDAAGIDNEIVIYEDAPHSFFDRTAEEHADDSADAWRRMLDFINRNRSKS
jgi:carboxymethylenebutenolidase